MTFPRDLYSKRSAEVLYGDENVYPKLADPVAVPSANTNWGVGALTQIMAAGVVTVPFVIVGVHLGSATEGSNNGWHQLNLYYGASDDPCGQVTFQYNGVARPGINARVCGGIGAGEPIPAGSRIRAELAYADGAGTGISTIDVGISYVEVTE